MELSRRCALLTGLASGGVTMLPNRGHAADLPIVKVGVGLKAMSSVVINVFAGQQIGFATQDGIKLQDLTLGGDTNLFVAADKGAADVITTLASSMLPLYAKGELPPLVAFYEYTYPYKFDIVVLPGSPIHSYADLRGKKIGISRVSSSEYPVTRAIFRNMGIDPDKDVSWVPVGEGVVPGLALQRGDIDALSYYDTAFSIIENSGVKLVYLPRPANIPMVGGLFLVARRDYIENHRDLCVACARTIAMTSEYLLANPEAGARAFITLYPQAAPRGVSTDEAVRQTVVAIERRLKLYNPPYAGFKLGQMSESEWKAEAEFAGLTITDLKPLFTNDLIDEINDYDHQKIIAAAQSAG